ncbi:MAG TPA: Ger(x)C family spore germination protein [Bacillota bacterium]|nr:Ger(x)C family spore germination protein [Bacillota bacterium]
MQSLKCNGNREKRCVLHFLRYAIRGVLFKAKAFQPNIRYAALILACLFSLPGCWDLEEVDRRAFATTIGIDTDPSHQIIVTVQVPIPQKMLPSGAGTAAAEGKNFTTSSIRGQSIANAFRELQTKTFRRLVIQQNKSVIISEDAATLGLSELTDWLSRNPKAPPQALVFITNGKSAQDILTFAPAQMVLPGLEFISAGLSAVKYDRTYFIPIWKFGQRLLYKNQDAYAPLIDIGPKEGNYRITGLAVFNGDKMAGKLDAIETQSFGILTGKMSSGGMSFETTNRKIISLRNVRGRTKIKIRANTGQYPFFEVKSSVTAILNERTDQKTNQSSKDIRELEKHIAQSLKQRLTAVIAKLQGYNADVIDFGEQFRIQQQNLWEKTNWKEIFPAVSYQVSVKVSLQKDGVLR